MSAIGDWLNLTIERHHAILIVKLFLASLSNICNDLQAKWEIKLRKSSLGGDEDSNIQFCLCILTVSVSK